MTSDMKIPQFVFVFIIIAVTTFAYAGSLSNGFVYDDLIQIQDNTAIRSFKNIPAVFTHNLSYFGGQDEEGRFYRPVQSLTLMVDFFLWGSSPFGYHMTNLVLHVIVAILFFYFALYITKDSISSCAVSAIYSAHPVHTEAVAYASGRADSIAAIFLLLMLFFRRRCWQDPKRAAAYYTLMLSSFALALLSKELAVIFPFLLIFFDYSFNPEEKRSISAKAVFYAPAFVIIAAWFMWKNSIVPTESMLKLHIPFATRLVIAPRLVWDYIRLSFLPSNLHMEYKVEFPSSVFQNEYFLPIVMLGVFAGIAFYLWRKGGEPGYRRIISFGLGFFLIGLLPYLNIFFMLNAVFAEHWLYISEMGLILAAGYALFYWLEKLKAPRAATLCVCLAICVVFSYITIRQNKVWRDNVTFYNYTLLYDPNNAKMHNNLAVAYIKEKRYPEARKHFEAALKIDPNYSSAAGNLKMMELEMRHRI